MITFVGQVHDQPFYEQVHDVIAECSRYSLDVQARGFLADNVSKNLQHFIFFYLFNKLSLFIRRKEKDLFPVLI
jgi:hypothetical protein